MNVECDFLIMAGGMGLFSALQRFGAGETAFQERKRVTRANARRPEYMLTANWMAWYGGGQTHNLTSWQAAYDLRNSGGIQAGHDAILTSNRNDIERKLAHGGGERSYLTALTRANGTVFVVWWVWREDEQYKGLKPYYLIDKTEKASDYWCDDMGVRTR